MSSTRSIIAPPPFATNALTVIPPTPVAGVSYRDATAGPASSPDGWPYAERVNSAEWNQLVYQWSSLLSLLDKKGVLGWSSLVDYTEASIAFGSDGKLYTWLLPSGPSNGGAKDPISNPTYWTEFKSLTFTPVQQGGGIGQAVNKVYLGYASALTRPSITVDSTDFGGVAFLSDLVFTKSFVSAPQAFSRGGLVTVPHLLVGNPKIITGTLICQTAENGWAVGDRQHIVLTPDNDDSTVVSGFGARSDATNIYARCGVTGPYGFNINTGGTVASTVDANWRLEVRAYL